jgi:hypothetical protein
MIWDLESEICDPYCMMLDEYEPRKHFFVARSPSRDHRLDRSY